jgi:hypothetical protein
MGYYTTQLITNEGRFVPLTPQRVEDSRLYDGMRLPIPLPAGVTPINTLAVNDELRTNHANAAAVNITVTEPAGPGYLSAYTGDLCQFPTHSNLNFAAGRRSRTAS